MSGDLQIATDGGNVRLRSLSGKLSVASGGGHVHLAGNLSALQSLNAVTDGGGLIASGNLQALRSLNATTGGGDIVIRTSGLSLHLNASTDGGSMHVQLPHMHNVKVSSHHFSGDIGTTAGTGTLRSDGGDINVSQLQSSP